MSQYRAHTHIARVDVEAVKGDLNADFNTEAVDIPCFDPSWKGDYQAIENAATRQDLGEHAPGAAHSFEVNECKFSTQMQGLGGIGAPVLQAVAPGQAIALGGVFGVDAQASARRSTGSTVKAASTPTVEEVIETDAGNHAVNQLVPFLGSVSGKYYVRPVITYATDTMTLGLNLPAADLPAVGSIIPGGSNVEWYDDTVAANLASIQAELVGQTTSDNERFLGMNGTASIPEKGPNEAPQLDLTFRAMQFNDLFVRAQSPSVVPLPYAHAGGEFLIAPYGSKVYTPIPELRLAIDFGATYGALEDHNDEDRGIEGWMRDNVQTRITLTVPQEFASPAGSSSGKTNFRESWRHNKLSDTPDRYHMLFSYGLKTIGRMFTIYFSDVFIADMIDTNATVNTRRAEKAVFGLLANSDATTPRVMALFS